jgi:lysophospholipase L1-like esterase
MTRGAIVAAVLIMGVTAIAMTLARSSLFGSAGVRELAHDPARAVVYVALGDSTVAGVGATTPDKNYVSRFYARLRTVYPNAHVENLGTPGATAADVVARQLPIAVQRRPDIVTLSIGPNDITDGREVAEYARDLETVMGTLIRETTAVVLVNLIPDLALTPRFKGGDHEAAIARRTVQFNDALGRMARTHRAQVVDLYAVSQREIPRHPELIATDGYHPSDQGYARWAQVMWQSIQARTR